MLLLKCLMKPKTIKYHSILKFGRSNTGSFSQSETTPTKLTAEAFKAHLQASISDSTQVCTFLCLPLTGLSESNSSVFANSTPSQSAIGDPDLRKASRRTLEMPLTSNAVGNFQVLPLFQNKHAKSFTLKETSHMNTGRDSP